jgi:putative ABC transport system permease protein
MYQFLTEAIVITQLGGVVGIVIGILVGNVLIIFTGGSFVVPWNWVIGSFFVCLLTGLFSGLYPAFKASRLDPIESLRYE